MTAPKPAARVHAEKPILFSAAMVRAILDGRKVQTRRILKPQPVMRGHDDCVITYAGRSFSGPPDYLIRDILLRYGVRWKVGDHLWVRETWADVNTENGPAIMFRAGGFHFCTDDAYPVEYDRYPGMQFSMWCGDLARGEPGHAWRPSIFMPRWASRITLEVADVRVQRLQDISYEDAIAEGVGDYAKSLPDDRPDETPEACARRLKWPQRAYAALWDDINGAGSWDANPFVVALTFRRVSGAD